MAVRSAEQIRAYAYLKARELRQRRLPVIRYDLETSLLAYTQAAWPLIEPATSLVLSWHLSAIAEHLEAVTSGEIRHLLITVPPRSGKSSLVSVMWPTWSWIDHPEIRWLFASYAQTLSTRDALRSRRIIQSAWYQQRWGHRYQLTGDQNLKNRYENNQTGYRIATSVGGSATGEGGSILCVDDAHNLLEIHSDTIREGVLVWWDEVMASRLNDPKTGARVIVQQRAHERDLAGHVLAQGEYVHLDLPMEYVPKTYMFHGKAVDPRTVAGELLCPERIGPMEIEDLKLRLGPTAFCTPAESPILMADFSLKMISEIDVGDVVVGFTMDTSATGSSQYSNRRLIPTTVHAVSESRQQVVRIVFASGRSARCTPDHLWYVPHSGKDRPMYREAKIGRTLARVCHEEMPQIKTQEEAWLAGWLAGFFDGEGSVTFTNRWKRYRPSALITFTQGADRNLPNCERLEESLTFFGFKFNYLQRFRHGHDIRSYWLKGMNVSEFQRFLHLINPTKWRDRLILGAFSSNGFISDRERIVAIEPEGIESVYGLTTETGNYIVWGLASSNSGQYNQQPAPAGGNIFKRWWWRYWQPKGLSLPPVMVQVPDGDLLAIYAVELPEHFDEQIESWDMAFKDLSDSDFVAGHVWGRKGADKFLLDRDHRRLDFPATQQAVRAMSLKWPQAHAKLVEDKANGPAIIASLRHEIPGLIAVDPGGGKIARAHAVTPAFEAGNVYVPHPQLYPWVEAFLHEHDVFPAGAFDDDVDTTTQALKRWVVGFRVMASKVSGV